MAGAPHGRHDLSIALQGPALEKALRALSLRPDRIASVRRRDR
jgi:hypothetical protein